MFEKTSRTSYEPRWAERSRAISEIRTPGLFQSRVESEVGELSIVGVRCLIMSKRHQQVGTLYHPSYIGGIFITRRGKRRVICRCWSLQRARDLVPYEYDLVENTDVYRLVICKYYAASKGWSWLESRC